MCLPACAGGSHSLRLRVSCVPHRLRFPDSLCASTKLLSWASIASSSFGYLESCDSSLPRPRVACALQSVRDPVGHPGVTSTPSLGSSSDFSDLWLAPVPHSAAFALGCRGHRRSPWTRPSSPSGTASASLMTGCASPFRTYFRHISCRPCPMAFSRVFHTISPAPRIAVIAPDRSSGSALTYRYLVRSEHDSATISARHPRASASP